jgi:hypothetical protein
MQNLLTFKHGVLVESNRTDFSGTEANRGTSPGSSCDRLESAQANITRKKFNVRSSRDITVTMNRMLAYEGAKRLQSAAWVEKSRVRYCQFSQAVPA